MLFADGKETAPSAREMGCLKHVWLSNTKTPREKSKGIRRSRCSFQA
jgi:hypothetical protein